MPIIPGGRVQIALRYDFLGQKCETVQWYRPEGAAFLTADVNGVLEAYWDNIKTAWRALIIAVDVFQFTELVYRDENPTGAFGSYSIPLDERIGTRALGSLGDLLPAFVAAGVKLTVDTRVTRPGQKRLPGLCEGDNNNGVLGAGYITLANAVAAKYSAPVVLGAPVATGTLMPIIVRQTGSPPAPSASQDVTGHVVNTMISSQVSRKPGHGS